MATKTRRSISGDMVSKLYNGRFSDFKSKFFAERGIEVKHYDTVKSMSFTSNRNASLPLLDGLGLVLADGVQSAKCQKFLDGQGNQTVMTTLCVIDPAVHSEICSFPNHQIRSMNGKIFSRLYRQETVTTFVTELASTGKTPKPNEGSCEPSLFSVVLCEAIGDVMLNQHGANITSKGMVQAWSDFLSDWRDYRDIDWIDDDSDLKNKVLLMSDWAWCALAYQENKSLLSTSRTIPFVAATSAPLFNAVNQVESDDFGNMINDFYVINGITKLFDTVKVAPNAISALS
jgi:hypothetical protein